ncbi:MAG: DtxR family transcriptional regulator [Deltaproteobacteria bacterium]|nr:MAG: DtxR family transcriptional regulator [Deltaproteobacteria bacterium]PIE72440.1 MAG: DtxR family transcriptional regulator [Deltaproteobacteria bacterium]
MESKKLTDSQEDYLEAIFQISEEKMAARAKDIATRLDVRASSVTGALKALSALGLVNYAPYDLITLTPAGKKVAVEIVHRHNALKSFFTTVLGVADEEADDAACKMEHSIPKDIVERLIRYAEFIEECPKGDITWKTGFGYFCGVHCDEADCGVKRGSEKDIVKQ